MIKLFHYADYPIPLREHSRYPLDKFRKLVDGARRSQCSAGLEPLPARRATSEEVLSVHSPEFVTEVLQQGLSESKQRQMGFPNSRRLAERALRIVGATLDAVDSALLTGVSGVLGGGAHHSFRDGGRGYCVFNDIAVACVSLLARGHERVLVFDCDVHQGDGTAHIFADNEKVITFSIHSRHNYPFEKQKSDVDIACEDDVSDEAYLQAVSEGIAGCVEQYDPEFVFYVAGADPFEADSLGRLNLSADCLRRRDEIVLNLCREMEIPLVILLGGGYCQPIDRTVELNITTFETAHSVYSGM